MSSGEYVDQQGIKYTIVESYYCVGNNSNQTNNNAGEQLSVPNVMLPSKIQGIPLARVGTYSFRTNTILQSIFIPNTVQILEYDCFAYTNLVNIQFDDFSTLHTLGRGVFFNCHQIKIIQLPFTVSSIGHLAFAQTALKILTIPGKISHIDQYVFGKFDVDFFLAFPEELRLNSKYKMDPFSDYEGDITFLRFTPMNQLGSLKAYFNRQTLLFTFLLFISN